ncbi:DUF4917 family protein [Xanthobacter sp. V3C-3]|uniref:DUF4917 family protein n=1 Tax=Xanthobacter lutulentifluminis TaxID=3119935 RepID=UPI00372A7849
MQIDDTLSDWDTIKDQFERPSLLVGNGFSQNIWPSFAYKSLFETADASGFSSIDKSLFSKFDTHNFEIILNALWTSKIVTDILGRDSSDINERYNSIRGALISAVHSVHIPWAAAQASVLDSISSELSKYNSVYSTNYDLIIYWSIMRRPAFFKDYFFSERFDINNTDIWGEVTKIHYLHGGLHLYRDVNGGTLKRRAEDGANLLDLFATPYRNALPLFISEGHSEEKISSIYRSDYLSFMLSTFRDDHSPMVIFGHGLGDSDNHISAALRSVGGRRLAISMLPGSDVAMRKADIHKKLPKAEKIYFFNAISHPLGSPTLRIV